MDAELEENRLVITETPVWLLKQFEQDVIVTWFLRWMEPKSVCVNKVFPHPQPQPWKQSDSRSSLSLQALGGSVYDSLLPYLLWGKKSHFSQFSSMWQDFVYIKTKWKYIINLRVECKTTKLQEENRENYFYYFRMGKNSNAWTI